MAWDQAVKGGEGGDGLPFVLYLQNYAARIPRHYHESGFLSKKIPESFKPEKIL